MTKANSQRLMMSLAALSALAISSIALSPAWSQTSHNGPVYRVGDTVTAPRVLKKVDPNYTEEARAAKISGTVTLQVVITPEGRADDITVIRSLDPGLDQKAVDALVQWEFEPGTKDGKPVAVAANIEVNFRLKD